MQNKENAFYSSMGLARKAGKLAAGTGACLEAIKKGKARLVIIACDTAENTLKKTVSACEGRNIDYMVYGDSERMGKALGKEFIKVVGILDNEFKKLILSKMQTERR